MRSIRKVVLNDKKVYTINDAQGTVKQQYRIKMISLSARKIIFLYSSKALKTSMYSRRGVDLNKGQKKDRKRIEKGQKKIKIRKDKDKKR